LESAVLEPYEKLITVTINGTAYEVPENNTLLRVLQHMRLELAYTKYCWNGDCRNCAFKYVSRRTGREVEALGCQMRLFANMTITRLPEGVTLGAETSSAPAATGATITAGKPPRTGTEG
jgi:2Fe-2S iron-sulfur cluster protein